LRIKQHKNKFLRILLRLPILFGYSAKQKETSTKDVYSSSSSLFSVLHAGHYQPSISKILNKIRSPSTVQAEPLLSLVLSRYVPQGSACRVEPITPDKIQIPVLKLANLGAGVLPLKKEHPISGFKVPNTLGMAVACRRGGLAGQ